MPPSDSQIRIAAAVAIAGGLGAAVLAIFPEALGVAASPGTFGWRRMSLLILGGIVFVLGMLLLASPRALFRAVDREQMRAFDRKVGIVGALLAVAGAAVSGIAIFAEQLGLGGEAARGEFGWKQVALLAVGGVTFAVGAMLVARPRAVSTVFIWARSRVSWARSRASREHWVRVGRQLRSRLSRWAAAMVSASDRFSERTRLGFDLMGLFVVLGAYAVAQFMLLKPPALGDPLDYFSAADELPDVSATHRHMRLGLLLPVRGFIQLFGYSEAAYYAVPLLAGLALAGFTYALGRMLFGWAVGLAAGLLVTLNPYVLWDSSHLLPDVPAAATLVGAIATLVAAGILHQRARAGSWAVALLVGGGFLLGWAYLTREYLLIMLPIALVVFLAYRIPWRRLGWVALGLAPPLILEAVWGTVNFGGPLSRFTTTAVSRGTGGLADPESVGGNAGDVIWQLPSHFISRTGGWVFVALLLAIALYGSVTTIRGDRRFLPLVAWVGGLWLVLTMVGLLPLVTGGDKFLLRLEKFRYWLPVLPGIVIGGLAVVHELIRRLARSDGLARPLNLLFLAGIILVSLSVGISSISYSSAFVRNGADQYLELRDFLRDEGGSYASLYIDHGAGQPSLGRSFDIVLPMYAHSTFGSPIWDGEVRPLENDGEFLAADEIQRGLVVLRVETIRWLIEGREGFRVPSYLLDPPPRWQPALISGNREIVAYSVTPTPPATALDTVGARDWQIITKSESYPAPDVTMESNRAVIELPEGGSVFVFDGRGKHTGPPEASDGLIHPGEVVWGRVAMAAEGLGSATVRCYFYGPPGNDSIAAAARSSYTGGVESIDYLCQTPDTGGPFQVRTAIDLRGPITLTLDDAVVHAIPE